MSRHGCWDHRSDPAAIRALQRWSAGDSTQVAAALSFASEGGADWSAAALTWLYSQSDADEELIQRRLVQFTLYAAARKGFLPTPEALAAAVGDAMALVRRPGRRTCPTIRRRALALQMRADDFGFLRSTAEHLLLSVIRRGVTNYLRACGYTDKGRESLAPTNRQTGNHGPETLAA